MREHPDDKIGLEVSEEQTVAGLPVGYMQFVEIAREIDKTNMKLIVFDEPTAVLTGDRSPASARHYEKDCFRGCGCYFYQPQAG